MSYYTTSVRTFEKAERTRPGEINWKCQRWQTSAVALNRLTNRKSAVDATHGYAIDTRESPLYAASPNVLTIIDHKISRSFELVMRTLLYNRAAPICNGSTLVISFLLRQKLFRSSALFHGFRDSSKRREGFVATAVLQYSKEIETKNLPMTYTNIRNNSILHNNPITL